MNFKDKNTKTVKKIEKPRYHISDWKDWRWQLQHTIKDIEGIEQVMGFKLSSEEKNNAEKVISRFPLSVTPYYLSLVNSNDYINDPIFKQLFPDVRELNIKKCDLADPLSEDKDHPVSLITHRYPDRVLFLVSNACAMYCRHCTRKRKVGEKDFIPRKKEIKSAIKYIKDNKIVRDVLLSGGDPLLMNDDYLEWILSELHKIPHVEIIRIGTRIPVVLPYRITDNLVKMLKKYQPLWLNTHFNHPREVTKSARQALSKLADAGIPLGNQSVLLAGVNDCPRIMKELVRKLVQNRVRPYYLYQCDLSEGISHFRTPVGKGIEIIEHLIGHTTGFAVPRYVIDAPGGGGKIPVMPNYLISWSTNKVILRNYEGVITTYKEPDEYKRFFCNRDCDNCKLQLDLTPASEAKAVGICRLFADYDKTISLTPASNKRIKRRK